MSWNHMWCHELIRLFIYFADKRLHTHPSSSFMKSCSWIITWQFILLGLTQDPVRKKIVFVTFLLFYLGTLLGNFLIITTIKTSQTLGSPMYFFLFHLSLSDTCFSTSIAGRMVVGPFWRVPLSCQWVPNPSLFILFLWLSGDLHPDTHGPGPLCGHL